MMIGIYLQIFPCHFLFIQVLELCYPNALIFTCRINAITVTTFTFQMFSFFFFLFIFFLNKYFFGFSYELN